MIVHNLNVKEIISINVEANAVLNIDHHAAIPSDSLAELSDPPNILHCRSSSISAMQYAVLSAVTSSKKFGYILFLFLCLQNSLSYIYIIPVLRAHVKQVYDLFFLMLFFVRLRTPSYK